MLPEPRPPLAAVDPPDTDGLLTSHEVAEHAGITFRQLDYWTRRGYVTAEQPGRGSGTQRRFTPEQADRVALLAALVHAGLTLDTAVSALNRAFTGGDTLIIPLTPQTYLTTHLTPLHAVTA